MVMDASVWVSRLVPQDVHHLISRRWLERYVAAGGLLVAPVLLLAEVAGAISRRIGEPKLARQAVKNLLHVPGLRLIPVDQRLGREAAQLAADLRLRGTDAMYVAMARHLNIPLVTWDQEQQERAGELIVVRTPEAEM
jgi:predicted nucleic acid-binding protein